MVLGCYSDGGCLFSMSFPVVSAVTVLRGRCWGVRTSCRFPLAPSSVCFHLTSPKCAVGGERERTCSTFTNSCLHTVWWAVRWLLTCLRKIRFSSRQRLGLSGACDHSRSKLRVPTAPKTFSSLKHPVSIIYRDDRYILTRLTKKTERLIIWCVWEMNTPHFARL